MTFNELRKEDDVMYEGNSAELMEISIGKLLALLLSKWWLILISVVIFFVGCYYYAYYHLENEYTSHSSMIVQVTNIDDNQTEYTNLLYGERLVATYSELVKSDKVLNELKEILNLDYSISSIRNMITIDSKSESLVIGLYVTSQDPELSASIANSLVSIVKRDADLYEGLQSVEVLDEASISYNPSGPNRMMYLMMGLLLGIAVGSGLVILIDLYNNSIESSEDLESKLQLRTLSVIPEYGFDDDGDSFVKRRITMEQPNSYVSESYNKLLSNIDFLDVDDKPKVINLTSFSPNNGKTITAINLATVYAMSGEKTLLIDLDLKRPTIHFAFGIPNKNGVVDYLKKGESLDTCIKPYEENLDLFVSGRTKASTIELLKSTKFENLINDLKKIYTRIIIDCPPLVVTADASIVSHICDSTLFVVEAKSKKPKEIKKYIDELKETGANVIGGVLTRAEVPKAMYEYYYNYYNVEANINELESKNI